MWKTFSSTQFHALANTVEPPLSGHCYEDMQSVMKVGGGGHVINILNGCPEHDEKIGAMSMVCKNGGKEKKKCLNWIKKIWRKLLQIANFAEMLE